MWLHWSIPQISIPSIVLPVPYLKNIILFSFQAKGKPNFEAQKVVLEVNISDKKAALIAATQNLDGCRAARDAQAIRLQETKARLIRKSLLDAHTSLMAYHTASLAVLQRQSDLMAQLSQPLPATAEAAAVAVEPAPLPAGESISVSMPKPASRASVAVDSGAAPSQSSDPTPLANEVAEGSGDSAAVPVVASNEEEDQTGGHENMGKSPWGFFFFVVVIVAVYGGVFLLLN